VLIGLLGFIAESKFDPSSGGDGGALDGERFIIFEVNGWHNVIHIASGLFLLALMRRHDSGRLAALTFGAIYGVVTVIGLIDGKDVLGLFPVNPADNILHIVLTSPRSPPGWHPFAPRLGRAPPARPRRSTSVVSPGPWPVDLAFTQACLAADVEGRVRQPSRAAETVGLWRRGFGDGLPVARCSVDRSARARRRGCSDGR
jgi:hypothetical protein